MDEAVPVFAGQKIPKVRTKAIKNINENLNFIV